MASLKFDYNRELIANMKISISKLDNAPMCHINFGLKDEKECRRNIFASVYKDAENQAQELLKLLEKVC